MTHKPHPVLIEQFGWKTDIRRDQLASSLMGAVILGGIAIVLDLKFAPIRGMMGAHEQTRKSIIHGKSHRICPEWVWVTGLD